MAKENKPPAGTRAGLRIGWLVQNARRCHQRAAQATGRTRAFWRFAAEGYEGLIRREKGLESHGGKGEGG